MVNALPVYQSNNRAARRNRFAAKINLESYAKAIHIFLRLAMSAKFTHRKRFEDLQNALGRGSENAGQ